MRRLPLVVLALSLLAALPGCGREQVSLADLKFQASPKTVRVSYPDVGMRFRLPDNMRLVESRPPGVFRGAAGDAFLSGFAYRRAEQLPRNGRELDAARRRLVAAAEKRSDSYRLRSARSTRVNGARAVELVGDQRLSKGRLRTRSLHVYEGKAEYVIEMGAQARDFAVLDRDVFGPIRQTLRVTGRVRGG